MGASLAWGVYVRIVGSWKLKGEIPYLKGTK